ncbi:MAG: hypothetical protein KC503_17530 [Myxococcales bacterium]|nr:hypothetical protein [Myxococcales bacterium]
MNDSNAPLHRELRRLRAENARLVAERESMRRRITALSLTVQALRERAAQPEPAPGAEESDDAGE